MEATSTPDIVIHGAGIAGLWTARRLIAEGISVRVVETAGVGGVQTLASQGVIHGGLKYALVGALTDSSEALRDMPSRWRAALDGRGEIDLRGVSVTSDHQWLWSSASLASRATAFFASKNLSSRIAPVDREAYPAPFNHRDFHGALYRLDEFALDVPSLVRALSAPLGPVLCATAPAGRPALRIFLAGEGNEALIAASGVSGLPAMQRRPLHQVWVRHPTLPPLFGVCMGSGPKPRLVVTTHRAPNGRPVWYLGGELAEAAGVKRTETEQISFARNELTELFPWIDWTQAAWGTVRVNRAEAADKSGDRPSGVTLASREDVLVGWPTKLALAPVLADEILAEVKARGIVPRGNVPAESVALPFAPSPWDQPL